MANGKLRHRLKISLRATMLVILLVGIWLGWGVAEPDVLIDSARGAGQGSPPSMRRPDRSLREANQPKVRTPIRATKRLKME